MERNSRISKIGSVEGSGHNVGTIQAEVGVRNVAEEHTPRRVSLVLFNGMVDHTIPYKGSAKYPHIRISAYYYYYYYY